MAVCSQGEDISALVAVALDIRDRARVRIASSAVQICERRQQMTDKHALCILGRLNKLSEVAARKYSKDEEILNLSQALQIGIDAIKQKRPQGEWDREKIAFYGVCTECGAPVASNLADIFLYGEIGKCPYNTNFCPNCGADMREAENDI